jgi:hypothetical protein
MGKLLAGATMAFLVGASLGRAADIQLGNDGGRYVIFVSGDIVEGDDQRFRAAAGNVAQAVVSLSSPGGSFVSGLQIAAIVHDRGYATIVAAGERCASVCGVIWLSGSTRYLTPSSKVGFHGVYNEELDRRIDDAMWPDIQ